MPEKILIVDDTPANMSILLDLLEPQGYTVSAAPNGLVALNVVPRLMPDLILLDVMMPELDGLETCRRLKANPPTADIPVLFLSARDDSASVLEGFAAGGADYIVKPFHPEEVLARVQAHLKLVALTRQLKDRNDELSNEIALRKQTQDALSTADARLAQVAASEAQKWGLHQFVGQSQTLSNILAAIKRLQNFATVNVLITGESGTGKELVARALHHGSSRASGPFIPVNCVAIPEELAESMLFGHLKGSFTGATIDRKGFFELAHGGTLFLDEIGDMPAPLQAKLLRVLEDGEVTPIGSATSRKVDVRIVAATNAPLAAHIPEGTFRRDLYFRLAQFTVHVPPLRDRLADVPLLAQHFLSVFATEMGMRPPRLSQSALDLLQKYHFPGNIRELKNIMERSLIEASGSSDEILSRHIHLSDLPPSVPSYADDADDAPPLAPSSGPLADLPFNLERAEALLIQRALAETGGNVAKAARLLGVNRTRIYRRFQESTPPADDATP